MVQPPPEFAHVTLEKILAAAPGPQLTTGHKIREFVHPNYSCADFRTDGTCLRVYHAEWFDDYQWNHLGAVIHRWDKLTELRFEDGWFGTIPPFATLGMWVLAAVLTDHPNTVKLYFGNHALSNESALILARMMRKARWTSVEIAYTEQIKTTGLVALAESLAVNQTITTFSSSPATFVDEESVAAFGAALGTNQVIRSFGLGCVMNCSARKYLLPVVRSHPTLIDLHTGAHEVDWVVRCRAERLLRA